MIDPTKAQSKAEASFRLAEIAKTPRARQLFRQLGEAYEKHARGELPDDVIEQMEAAPLLAPAAPAAVEVAQDPQVPLVPDLPLVADAPAAAEVALVAEAPPVPKAPAAPAVPITETEHFLAVLKAFREEAARSR